MKSLALPLSIIITGALIAGALVLTGRESSDAKQTQSSIETIQTNSEDLPIQFNQEQRVDCINAVNEIWQGTDTNNISTQEYQVALGIIEGAKQDCRDKYPIGS